MSYSDSLKRLADRRVELIEQATRVLATADRALEKLDTDYKESREKLVKHRNDVVEALKKLEEV